MSSAEETKHLLPIVKLKPIQCRGRITIFILILGPFSGWGVHNCAPEEVVSFGESYFIIVIGLIFTWRRRLVFVVLWRRKVALKISLNVRLQTLALLSTFSATPSMIAVTILTKIEPVAM